MTPFITMGNKPGKSNRKSQILLALRGIAAILIVWQILSWQFSSIIIASPASTFLALGILFSQGAIWSNLGYSLVRLIIGLLIGSILGIILGVLAGRNSGLRTFLEPARWVAMTVPAVIISILAMLWFGLGSSQVIFMTAVITLPVNYINTLEGMLSIDARITEMARVYQIPGHLRWREIYFPGIGSAVIAGLTLAAGIGVRALVLAEFLGARDGIGHRLFLSWTFLDTPQLFAWILMCFLILGIIEFGALRPARSYLMRWKRAN